MGEQTSHVEQLSGTSNSWRKWVQMLIEPSINLVCPPGESALSQENTIDTPAENGGTRPTAVEEPSHEETNGDSMWSTGINVTVFG